MNLTIMCGRLTADPEVRYGENQKAVAKFSLAVDRKFKRENEPTADFIKYVAFGKLAEFVEKYLVKGTKVIITGKFQNNNYTNKDGQNVYDYQLVADEIEFAESKHSSGGVGNNTNKPQSYADGQESFMNIPQGIDDELPFN